MAAVATTPASPPAKKRKPRITFMLHHPDTMANLGKFVSTDYRYAALKAATRGTKRILLRKTNTKEVREFAGDIVPLPQPKVIQRMGREIVYTKKPKVRFVRGFVYKGPLPADETAEALQRA